MAVTTPGFAFNRRLYVSKIKEAAYGTAAALGIVFNPRREGSPIRPTELLTDDRELSTGKEAAFKQIHLGRDLTASSFGMPLTPEALGWALAFAMGNDSPTAHGTDGYSHALAPVAVTTGFPGSFTLEEHLSGTAKDDDTDYIHLGCVIDEVTISGGRTGLCQIDVTVSGSGKLGTLTASVDETALIQPGVWAPTSAATRTTYFVGEAVKIGIKAQSVENDPEAFTLSSPITAWEYPNFTDNISDEINISDVVDTWSVTYRNNWAQRRYAGLASSSGIIGGQPVWHSREVVWEFNFLQSAGFDSLIKALAAGTSTNNVEYSVFVEGSSDVDITSDSGGDGFAGFHLVTPLAMIEANPSSTFGDINTESVTFRAKSPVASDTQGQLLAVVSDSTPLYNQ